MKKIAVVGFGFMGVVHAKNILNSDDLELCAIVDNRDGDIFADIANTGNQGELDLPLERLRQTLVFKTLEECVKKVHPDAVVICVPLFLHYELTKKALELGLDVLLEKPFCPKLEQCQELIGLAEANQRILMVAHCIRFAPQYEFLAQCIRDGRYGPLRWLNMIRLGGEPAWGVWQDEKIKKTCGGSLFDLLIHDIDFAGYCLGTPTGMKVNLNIDEYWELAFDYAKTAAKVSVTGGFLHRNTAFAAEYAATFEKCSVRFSTLQPETVHIGTDAGAEAVDVTGDAYFSELAYFTNCVQSRGRPEKCLPEESLRAVEVCQKIKKKINTGLTVFV